MTLPIFIEELFSTLLAPRQQIGINILCSSKCNLTLFGAIALGVFSIKYIKRSYLIIIWKLPYQCSHKKYYKKLEYWFFCISGRKIWHRHACVIAINRNTPRCQIRIVDFQNQAGTENLTEVTHAWSLLIETDQGVRYELVTFKIQQVQKFIWIVS